MVLRCVSLVYLVVVYVVDCHDFCIVKFEIIITRKELHSTLTRYLFHVHAGLKSKYFFLLRDHCDAVSGLVALLCNLNTGYNYCHLF